MKSIAVVHLTCAECGHPVSARELDSAYRSLLEHAMSLNHASGVQQAERIALGMAAARVIREGETR